MTKVRCDIAIIGAGPGGLSIAAVAAPLGLKVVLIEAKRMGGDCLNTGCIPSKSLIAAARSAHSFLTAGKYGIEPTIPLVNFNKVMEHIAGVINTIAPHDSVERFTKLGATVILATAKFIDHNTVLAGETLLKARHIIIATGSSATVPPIPGLDSIPFLTNETIFKLRDKPSHLIIIGGGPIGCELAQAFLFLGIKVTVLEAFSIMPHDDADLVQILRDQFISQGLLLHEGVKIINVRKYDDGIDIIFQKNGKEEVIHGSHVLVAAGRRPNTDTLELDKAGVAFNAKGIQVDKYLRTSNKKIYAIGDVIGSYQFTHIANYHAGIVIRNVIFKLPASVNYRSIPWVTYVSPELAHAGLTNSEALKINPHAKILTVDLIDNDRAQTERETLGKIKIITTPKGKILGVSILAQNAGELILPWILLINDNKTLRNLTDAIVPYPTLSELSKRVASEFYSPSLFSRHVRLLVRFLNWI